MKATKSFTSLSKVHEILNRMFDSHQRALIDRTLDRALTLLTEFGIELERHIDFEERRLLPLYADQGGETPGGTLELFQAEHRKLRDSVKNLIQQTELLFTCDDLPGAILDLLDDETTFKGLLHHHARREQKYLFPRLDERTTEEEHETWLREN